MDFDSIIFDLDGTLWDSAEGICGTWREILDRYNNTEDIPRLCRRRVLSSRSVRVQSPTERKRFCESPLLVKSRALKELGNIKITVDALHACMGLPLDEIAKKLLPGMSPMMQKKLMKECCDYENIYLSEHGGILFPELEETLEYLSGKYRLFIVSNCQEGYIESFFAYHKTEKYFSDIECNGATGLSKGENNKLIIKRNCLKDPVYVGDTAGDLQSARDAEIPFIYAEYGFGEVPEYDYKISKFSDLASIL